MNSIELIALGVRNARELFKITRDKRWIKLAGLYLTAKDMPSLQRGKVIARLIKAETDLTAGKEIEL